MPSSTLELPTVCDELIENWVQTARAVDLSQRRQQKRVPFFRAAQMVDQSGKQVAAFSRDISPDGIGLLHHCELAKGEQIAVTVYLDNREIDLIVQTEWCHPVNRDWFLSGGSFVGLTVKQGALLLMESIRTEFNRRWRQRYPMFRAIDIGVKDSELRGFSLDVSLAGMGILVREPIRSDTVFIRVQDENSQRFTLRARTVWCDEREHGWHVAGCEFKPLEITELPEIFF